MTEQRWRHTAEGWEGLAGVFAYLTECLWRCRNRPWPYGSVVASGDGGWVLLLDLSGEVLALIARVIKRSVIRTDSVVAVYLASGCSSVVSTDRVFGLCQAAWSVLTPGALLWLEVDASLTWNWEHYWVVLCSVSKEDDRVYASTCKDNLLDCFKLCTTTSLT